MRIGSLFAGIGGFDLAARWMGWTTAWYSEIEPYPNAVMAQHFPEAKALGDIRAIQWEAEEWVDLMCGGFPCQDLSQAGKRKGLAGERSGLWSEYARAVRAVRPRWVVIENVPPLLAGGFAVVRGDLRSAGYRVARPVLMSASAVGAPHRRERLWIVAHAATPRLTEGLRGTGRTVRHGARWAEPQRLGADVADTQSDGLEEQRLPAERRGLVAHASWRRGLCENAGEGGDWWAVEPDVGRVATRVPARVDRLAGLGNAIVPQCALAIFREIAKAEGLVSAHPVGGAPEP